jgi:hypothetical protein
VSLYCFHMLVLLESAAVNTDSVDHDRIEQSSLSVCEVGPLQTSCCNAYCDSLEGSF